MLKCSCNRNVTDKKEEDEEIFINIEANKLASFFYSYRHRSVTVIKKGG